MTQGSESLTGSQNSGSKQNVSGPESEAWQLLTLSTYALRKYAIALPRGNMQFENKLGM